MSTTTQILFNSPALHSLKRDQLVKLCKIHSIKANGKNKDLIERLQVHAQTLPPDDPLRVATRGERSDDEKVEEEKVSEEPVPPRPSEQWEIVMDSIAEVDENTGSTLKSNRAGNTIEAGEFGTNGSKASSVSSSLKAIATSLGLKRGSENSATNTTTSSKSSLSSTASGQSRSTAPTELEPEVEPVPGQDALAGRPAPSDARLSISQEPATTTIRLVSSNDPKNSILSPPRLHPFKTSFEIVPMTPGAEGSSGMWPLSPGVAQSERLYPPIPTFSAFQPTDTSDMDIDIEFTGSLQSSTPARAQFKTGATPKSVEKPSNVPNDIFSPAPKATRPKDQLSSFRPQRSTEKAGSSRSEAFIFGSPDPQHRLSNVQFRNAAQSVLDEMNTRLEAEGIAGVDIEVLKRGQQFTLAQPTDDDAQQETKAELSIGAVFDKAHQAQFDKMDSITSHYAARRGLTSKPDPAPVLGKRKSSAAPIAGKKRNSSIVVKKDRIPSISSVKLRTIPKKGVPGGFGNEDDSDSGTEQEEGGRQHKRVCIDPIDEAEREREEAKKLKEREAIRRKLDANKAKRRSSMGRPSVGRGIVQQPKQTSRLGFFSSAKKLVANVWNRGAGGSRSAAPAPAAASGSPMKSAVPSISSEPTKELPPKTQSINKKPSIIPNSSAVLATVKVHAQSMSNGKRVASESLLAPPTDSTISSRSSGSRAPQFTVPATSSRTRSDSAAAVSSLGVASSTSSAGRASSTSTKASLGGTLKGTTTDTPRARTSTLMAPTASSMAKKSRIPVPTFSPLNVKGKDREKETGKGKQGSLTSPRVQGRIFSQPLMSPTAKPVEPQISLGAMAATLTTVKPIESKTPLGVMVTATATSAKPPIPPKPKIMPGRRPHISRAKVIAKLASQREAQQGGTGINPTPRTGAPNSHASVGVPKVRSSMNANIGRQSHGVVRAGASGDVMMSAKKRARRSEYARRRSRADGDKMNVDR